MRIINRKEFLTLPENTLYRKYDPQIFCELEIKRCSPKNGYINDFLSQQLTNLNSHSSDEECHLKDRYEETSESFKLCYNSCGRDGLFDKNQLFAIYDNEDIEELINTLKTCIK